VTRPCACSPVTPQNLYNNVSYMYPNATIWLIGHSVSILDICSVPLTLQLGGSVSSLIGLSFGAPVVTFEAPGERLAAQRLHLPLPPGMPSNKTGITHIYHTADPIPMGACTGAYSGCYAAGFVSSIITLSEQRSDAFRRRSNRNVIPVKRYFTTQSQSKAGLWMSELIESARSSTRSSLTLGQERSRTQIKMMSRLPEQDGVGGDGDGKVLGSGNQEMMVEMRMMVGRSMAVCREPRRRMNALIVSSGKLFNFPLGDLADAELFAGSMGTDGQSERSTFEHIENLAWRFEGCKTGR